MRLINCGNKMAVLAPDGCVLDVADVTGGRISSDPEAVFAAWDDLREWVSASTGAASLEVPPANLGAPSPSPKQVFAVGMNYRSHLTETGSESPRHPSIFTKFVSCLAGADTTVQLPSQYVDWEVEVVAVIGRHTYKVSENDAWSHVAGLCVGQDLSERVVQTAPPSPQFSLGKSFPGFGPFGPALVTPDEFENPDDLLLCGTLNGETVQEARTSDMLFAIPELVARISKIAPMFPGDVVFTGTPGGVGVARKPPLFLRAGDVLVSELESAGAITTRFT